MNNQKTAEHVVKFAVSAIAATFFFFVALTGFYLFNWPYVFTYVLGFLTGWFIFQTVKNYILFMRSL